MLPSPRHTLTKFRALDRASDALHAALIAARDNGFWVGIGIGELNIPRFAGALGAVSTSIAPAMPSNSHASPSKKHREVHPYAASASAPITATCRPCRRLRTSALRVCAGRTEAEWRVVNPVVPGVRGQQKAAATALGITTQAVSRALVRSLWHEEHAARGALIELLTRIDRSRRRPLTPPRIPHSFRACQPFVPVSAESNT